MTDPEYDAACAAYEAATAAADVAYTRIAETEAAQKLAEGAWSEEWDLVARWMRRLSSNLPGVEADARVRDLREAADAAAAARERAFEEWGRLFDEAERLEAIVTAEDDSRIAAEMGATA